MVLAVLASLAIAGQSQASVIGEPIEPEFNYASIYIGTTIGGDLDAMVIRPPAEPLKLNGTYTDTDGNFSLPKDTGLTFPPLEVDLSVAKLTGDIRLAGPGTGHYDAATGEMDLDLDLSLTLGVDDLEALSEQLGVPLGSGAVACELSPLEVEFSTGKEWPHPGKSFTDKDALTDGALAGVWRSKPPITAIEGEQSVCNLVGGFLKPVGGIWIANSSTEIVDWPKPEPPECPPGWTLADGVCQPDWQHPCGVCVPPEGKAELKGLKLKPLGKKLQPGGTRTLALSIRNTGNKEVTRTIRFRSGNPRVRIQRLLPVTLPADSTTSQLVKVSAGRKAKGRSVITASVAGLKAKTTLVLARPAKRR